MKENTDWHGCDGSARIFLDSIPCPSIISMRIHRFFRYISPQRRKVHREHAFLAFSARSASLRCTCARKSRGYFTAAAQRSQGSTLFNGFSLCENCYNSTMDGQVCDGSAWVLLTTFVATIRGF
jgi:hypothetical protein